MENSGRIPLFTSKNANNGNASNPMITTWITKYLLNFRVLVRKAYPHSNNNSSGTMGQMVA